MTRLMLVVFLLLPWGAGATESALGPDAPPAAEQRYQIGVGLYREGKYAEAAREFSVALELVPGSARLAYNLARSLERAGELGEAKAAYQRYLELDPQADDHAAVKGFIAAIDRALEKSLSAFVVTSDPAGAQVFVGDAAEAVGATPVTLRLAEGSHALRFALEGHVGQTLVVEATAGRAGAANVVLAPVGAPQAAAGSAGSETTTEDPSATKAVKTEGMPPLKLAGWIATGLGVGGAVLGTVFHVSANSKADDAKSASGKRHDDLQSEFESDRLIGWVGVGAGAVLIGTGVALLLWPEDSGPVSFLPTGNGAML